MSKSQRPKGSVPATPASRVKQASGRRWVIVMVLAAIAAAGVFFIATRPKSVADYSPAAAAGFLPTKPNPARPPGPAPEGMVWIPGGEFSMGSDVACECLCGLPGVTRDAVPIHRVYVDGFWMDKTDVTNEKFQKFVNATGYVTIAERAPTREEFPTAPPENLVAGSTVFTPTPGPVPLENHYQWWRYQPGANWRHPEGPDTDLEGKEKYPVVHIAYRGRGGLRQVGRQAAADRGRVGVRGARRAHRQDLRLGRRFEARRQMDGQHLRGQVPGQRHGRGRLCRASRQSPSFRPTATASTTWPATSGSGAATGTAPTTTRQLAEAGGVARNPQGPDTPSIRPSRPRRSAFTAAARSSAPTSIAPATWSARAAKVKSSTGSNHVGFRCVKGGAS